MTIDGLVVGVITLAALCGAAMVPVEEADFQLTASDTDTGNWTANMGEMEVNIEHEHNSGSKANGTWTLTMARTFFDKEEDGNEINTSHEKANESSKSTEEAYTTTPAQEENISSHQEFVDDAIAPNIVMNSIQVDENPSKDTNIPDSYSPDYPNFIPQQVYPLADMFRMLPPPPPPQPMGFMSQFLRRYAPFSENITPENNDDLDSDEVVLDPDNFEYFKGIGWFKLDNRAMSWEEAKDACSVVGAHLAVPDTQDRVRVFLKLFQRHPEIPRTAILRAQVYVGVSDPQLNRVFTTVQGNVFNPDFPIWFTNEPDNSPPGESCVTFHMEGKTRDVPCFYRLPFFCEKDLPVVI